MMIMMMQRMTTTKILKAVSVECPNCREVVVVPEDLLDQDAAIEVTCPGCGEVVLIDDEDWEEEDLEELLDEEEKEEVKGEKKED